MEQVSMNTPLDSLSNAINDMEYHLKYSSYKIAPEMQERILKVGTKFREYVAVKQTPNPMIEGEEIAGWRWNKERILDLIGFIKDYGHAEALFQDYLKFCKRPDSTMPMIHSSQPIVKGEGKFGYPQHPVKGVNTDIHGNPFGDPAPKPDSMQGEKVVSDTFNPGNIGVPGITTNAIIQPKALPDINEGEIRDALQDLSPYGAHPHPKNQDKADGWEEGFKAGVKWLQSHQTTPPTDSKNRSKEEILRKHGLSTKMKTDTWKLVNRAMQEWGDQEVAKEREVIRQLAKMYDIKQEEYLELKSELQTLRDNNSKLVEALKGMVSLFTDEPQPKWVDDKLSKAKQALQSITQQDNKQKGI